MKLPVGFTRLIIFLIIMVTTAGVFAQVVPVVRINTFSGEGISQAELYTLERLVASHIVELRSFRVTDDSGRALVLSEVLNTLALGVDNSVIATENLLLADYIVSGSVLKAGEMYVVSLSNTRVSSGETLMVSDTYNSVNDMILRSRILTRNLFQRQDSGSSDVETVQSPGVNQALTRSGDQLPEVEEVQAVVNYNIRPEAADLVGTWRGDRNLESVRLFINGTGVAVMSAGGTLRLKYTIKGEWIEIVQNQVNDPRLYRTENIDHPLALQIAKQARAFRWEFRLSEDGSSLIGIKHGVAISGTVSAIQVDNTYTSEIQWLKTGR
ncbi:MAG: hypothetical protein KKI09_12680 [Spirochaetes bacterium]|nr:hypothetical protein [Spirochaetota bacterium]MBU0956277.1 hypothetical protein [Spirochaetota bacterium]